MSDSEESVPELPLEVPSEAAPEAKPKKKTARKRNARKRAESVEESPKPVEEAATPAASPSESQESVPEVFSASPDDVDDHGDISRRQGEAAEESGATQSRREFSDSEAHIHEASSHGSAPDRGVTEDSKDDGTREDRPSEGDTEARPARRERFNKRDRFDKKKRFEKAKGPSGGGPPPQGQGPNRKEKFKKGKGGKRTHWQNDFAAADDEELDPPVTDALFESGLLLSESSMEEFRAEHIDPEAEPLDYTELSALKLGPLVQQAESAGLEWEGAPSRRKLLTAFIAKAAQDKCPVRAKGIVEIAEEGYGFIVFAHDNYRLKTDSPYLAPSLITRNVLQRGHEVEADLHAPLGEDTCPFASKIHYVMGKTPEEIEHLTPFKELTAYYPSERIVLEAEQGGLKKWDNISMRVVDLLSPVGLGQRGLIVAPPRTGKTVLLQGIANSIRVNCPKARLIILLVDERPEEVTDFKRSVSGAEVIASTFDEAAESHVHAAEMVCEKARRLVEVGEDVIILLDSITRLARAYNTMMPSSGKILSGGVEANALQKPKRFFGSARKIEEGGSLTILGTALVETGSKMDEVIFEEFKGTGNLELHLDRELSNKRVFPALSFEKSGTRKEEMLYHPDEMEKVYSLRRAMKGVPSVEAMEMLIQRIKKTTTNAQFLMGLQR